VVKVLDFNVGKTGFNEQEAKELGFDYVAVTTAALDKPHYMEGSKLIAIKLLADPETRKVLGAQAVGEGDVSKRIDVIASVLTFGGTIDDLFDIDLSYAPPYNSPIDNATVAANVMMNKLEGRFKGISSLEAKELMKDEKIVFLDVRTPKEWGKSRLAGTKNIINISLSDLRKRSGELSKDAEIVAYCKVSLRGYEAAGILEGEAFRNIKVMEGGLFSWPFEEEKG
jgi:rhodanese-related sulfurtransferase